MLSSNSKGNSFVSVLKPGAEAAEAPVTQQLVLFLFEELLLAPPASLAPKITGVNTSQLSAEQEQTIFLYSIQTIIAYVCPFFGGSLFETGNSCLVFSVVGVCQTAVMNTNAH